MLVRKVKSLGTAVLGVAFASALGAGCEQRVLLPSQEAAEADVKRLLGNPTRIEKRPDDDVAGYVASLPSCAGDAAKRVATLWIYERSLHKEVAIALDAEGKVVCAGHGGITFVQ